MLTKSDYSVYWGEPWLPRSYESDRWWMTLASLLIEKEYYISRIAIDFESFLSNNLSCCYVVFGGYEGPSTKIMNSCDDLEKYLLISQLLPMCHKNQEAFLSNRTIKYRL